MRKSLKSLPLVVLSGLVLSLLLVSACNKKGKEGDKPIEAKKGPVEALHEVKVPAEVFVWAVTGNPQKLLMNMETIAGKAAPVPSAYMAQSINDYLVKMGFKDTSVINLSAPAGVVILNTMKYPIPFLVAVSTKGQKPFLASLKPAWKQKGEEKGVYHLSREIVDPYAVFKGGQNAAKSQKTEQSMYVKFDGLTALISLAPAAIQDAGKFLIERLKDGAPDDGLYAALHVDNMRTAFAVQLSMMPQLVKQQIEKSITEVPAQVALSPKAIKWILGWLSDKGFAFIQQTKQITMAMGVTPNEATIHTGFVAEPGSFFEKFLKEQKHTKLSLANGLPGGPFLAIGMNVQWKSLLNDMVEFTKEAFVQMMGKEIPDETMALIKQWLEITGDEVCVSEDLGQGGSLDIVELIRITDEKKADELMKKMMAFMAELYSSKSGLMGIKATVEGPKPAGEFDGVKLNETIVSIDLKSLPAMQAEILKKTYSNGKMRFMTAVFDKTLALTMGNNCEKAMKDAIGRVKKGTKGLTKSAAFTSASGNLGKDTGGFAFMSLSNLIYFSVQAVGVQQNQQPRPEPKSGMYFNFSVDGGTLFSTMRLPAAHLEEIGKAVQSLTQLSNAPAPKAPAPASK